MENQTHPLLWASLLLTMAALLALGGIQPLPFGFIPSLLGIGFLVAARLRQKSWIKLDWPLYGWLLALFILTASSYFWSITPEATFERSLKVCGLLLCALPLIDLARAIPVSALHRWQMLFPIATIIAGLYPLIELQLDFPIQKILGMPPPENVIWGSNLNKHVSIFIMMLAPALLICHRAGAYSVSAVMLIMAGVLIATTESQAAQLALLVIPLAWCGSFILPGTGIPLAFTLAGALLLLMPWLSPIAFDMFAADMNKEGSLAEQASVSMRLENWDFISRKIMENPATGFGMDATRSINDFQTEKLYFLTSTIMHPHNIALQLWIEFGALGVALMLGFFAFLLRRLLRLPRAERRIPFTVFCVVLSFLMVSWSIWASWLLGFIVFLTAVTILASRTSSARVTS
jgi:O-antigen ligase